MKNAIRDSVTKFFQLFRKTKASTPSSSTEDAKKIIQQTLDYAINMQGFLNQFESLTKQLEANSDLSPSHKLEEIYAFQAELKKFQEEYKGNKNKEAQLLDKKLAENIYNYMQQILIAARSRLSEMDYASAA